MGIDKGNTTNDVILFDSIYGIEYPGVSGQDGGGNAVHWDYNIQGTPTLVVITPDKLIAAHQVYPPSTANVIDSVLAAGGIQQACTTGLPAIPTQEEFLGVAPNPFRGPLTITLDLKRESILEVAVVNLTGQRIRTIGERRYTSGHHRLQADLSAYPDGIYFVQLKKEGQVIQSRKLVLYR